MADVGDLYQSIILDHNRSPRNFRRMEGASRTAEGRNPLCGDHVTIWLRIEGDVIEDVSFVGEGCAISKASASMMTAAIKGKSRRDAEALFERFHEMITGKGGGGEGGTPDPALGRLAALAGVARFPMRVKCASLAWHALRSALASDAAAAADPPTVSTEQA
jgi:nitrogen fixation NifU-like protein